MIGRIPGVRGVLRLIALNLLPEPILYRFLHSYTRERPRTALGTATDHRMMPLQDGVELWVYWSDVPNVGRGPSASLFVLREEILRLDCFSGNEGHMHLNPAQQRMSGRVAARLFFQDGSHAEHVDRAVFELIANSDAALKSNRLDRVRSFRIDEQALADASKQMRGYMMELLDRHRHLVT